MFVLLVLLMLFVLFMLVAPLPILPLLFAIQPIVIDISLMALSQPVPTRLVLARVARMV